ncbi:Uncharacterised protein [Mycobacteroides abscessus subsp. abscessus]|nr:Uncharacterised protein [Mycobacteroides abscessus subsp. abscessus]
MERQRTNAGVELEPFLCREHDRLISVVSGPRVLPANPAIGVDFIGVTRDGDLPIHDDECVKVMVRWLIFIASIHVCLLVAGNLQQFVGRHPEGCRDVEEAFAAHASIA